MRPILAAALAALPAIASAQDTASSQDCPDGMRPFEHAAGTDCIPVDPQRIVALQDQNVLLPLMELGVVPLGASGGLLADGTEGFRRLDGYDTSGVAFLGMHREEDVEAVAALEPDLIVTTTSPDWHHETFSKIAPTIVIDMFTQPVGVALHQFADAVNRTGRANALEAALDARAAELREGLGDVPDRTRAMVLTNIGGTLRTMPWVQGFGAAFEAIGFERTEWEAENAAGIGSVEFPREALGTVEADAIFVIDFSGIDGPEGQYEQVMADPLFRLHPTGQAGQVFEIDGTRMGGTSWLRRQDGVEQIAAILSDPAFRTDLAE
jgi:iron complex transport system substrate-binding protein